MRAYLLTRSVGGSRLRRNPLQLSFGQHGNSPSPLVLATREVDVLVTPSAPRSRSGLSTEPGSLWSAAKPVIDSVGNDFPVPRFVIRCRKSLEVPEVDDSK